MSSCERFGCCLLVVGAVGVRCPTPVLKFPAGTWFFSASPVVTAVRGGLISKPLPVSPFQFLPVNSMVPFSKADLVLLWIGSSF